MAENKKTRKSHTVPKGYLKRFANERGLIHVLRRDGKEFNSSVTHATVRNEFYDLPGNPFGADKFEGTLARFESCVPEILGKLDSRESLCSDERFMTAQYAAFQVLRGLAFFEALNRECSRASRPNAVALGASSEISSTVFVRRIDLEIDSVSGLFAVRPWTFVFFSEPVLITSDEPISLLSSKEAHAIGIYETLIEGGRIFFPLGRAVGLVIEQPVFDIFNEGNIDLCASGGLDSYRVGAQEDADQFNLSALESASDMLICHPDDVDILHDLERRHGWGGRSSPTSQ